MAVALGLPQLKILWQKELGSHIKVTVLYRRGEAICLQCGKVTTKESGDSSTLFGLGKYQFLRAQNILWASPGNVMNALSSSPGTWGKSAYLSHQDRGRKPALTHT